MLEVWMDDHSLYLSHNVATAKRTIPAIAPVSTDRDPKSGSGRLGTPLLRAAGAEEVTSDTYHRKPVQMHRNTMETTTIEHDLQQM